MSKGIRFGASCIAATRRAPATPPAGPDNTVAAAIAHRLLHRSDAAVREHDEQGAPVAGLSQPLLQSLQVAANQRADIALTTVVETLWYSLICGSTCEERLT